MIMIKLNSDKGREIVSDYITALNGDVESIKWAYDKIVEINVRNEVD